MLKLWPLFSILFFACYVSHAQGSPDEGIRIDRLLDHDNMDLMEINALPDDRWQVIKDNINRSVVTERDYWSGSQGAILWLRLYIPKSIATRKHWLELVPNVGLDGQLAVYENRQWQWFLPEGKQPESEGSAPVNFLTFVLEPANEAKTYYLKLNTSQVFHFGINIRNEHDQMWYLLSDNLFNGIVFGLLALALFYNVAIGFSAGERMYLYYGFYVFCNAGYLCVISGYSRLLFPDWGGEGYLSNTMVLMVMFSATIFLREFLNTAKTTPLFDRILTVQQWTLLIASLFVSFVSDFAGYLTAEILGVFCPMIILVAGFISLRAGHPLAKYFMIAWTMFLVCAGVWGWMWLGLIPPELWVLDLLKAGTISEITLLSLVLGYRYSYLKKQTESLFEAKTRFKTLSETDELTGVLNRRGFLKHVEQLMRRGNRDLVWLALDIDHFKQFNDNYGHLAGDQLLNAFGTLLATKGRREDLAARLVAVDAEKPYRRGVAGRMGGEEFAVLLVDCSLPRARLYAERLLREFEKLTVTSMDGDKVGTTLSIGGTQITPEDSVETAWSRADRWLYEAKDKGRNQVVMR